jgi:iron complex transport system permease protein
MRPPRLRVLLPGMGLLLLALAVVSLGAGSVSIAPGRVLEALTGEGAPADTTIVRDIRLPRVVLAMLVGGMLGLSGAVMQGFFQNPMADPYIIGVSSGAALGATLSLSLSLDFWVWGISSVSVFAFAGALLAALLVAGISLRGGRLPVAVVLLSGVAVASLASALTPLVMLATRADLQRIFYWLMGSLAARRWDHVQMVWPYALGGAVFLQFYARDLNLILQGEEQAQYLGVEVEKIKRLLLVASALLTASAVAVSGVIGFVGLIVPHAMRLLVGPDHRRLFPASVLGGALLVAGADLLARLLLAPAELPIGVITSLLGCPFFLYLLRRSQEGLAR